MMSLACGYDREHEKCTMNKPGEPPHCDCQCHEEKELVTA